MKEGSVSHLRTKSRGQAMVEFVIALPILLFLIFGIIEFARMVFAWMAVQNAARFGIRYAVTGEFKEAYCVEAGNLLGAAHVNADIDGGDPQDCLIPNSYTGADSHDKERELIDLARLFSIQDASVGGGTGLWLRPNVSGNYEQFLANHNVAFIGLPDEEGFYHITTCSNRNGQYGMDYGNYAIPLCEDLISTNLMDDAGGPGDRVKVHVEHQHPLFLPLISSIWPSVNLNAERDGIVEKFRTSRSLGVSGPILSAATWTQTPTITDTPTETPTSTLTLTPTITNTPIPVDCDKILVESSFIGDLGGGNYGTIVRIRNTNPVPIHLFQANVNWEVIPPSRYLETMQFNVSPLFILNDFTPPTTWNPLTPIELAVDGLGEHIVKFKPVAEPVQGGTSIDLVFEDDCHKGITSNLPTSTPTFTPTVTATPTITPTPDCSQYSMTGFTFSNFGIQNLFVTNNDVVDATVSQIQFDWDYAEQYGNANGYPNLNVDWFTWNGAYIPSTNGQDGVRDYGSGSSWSGSRSFNSGSTYNWALDFDSDWGGGGSLSGMINNDFGVIIDFTNGCQLSRNAVPRVINSWTPTPTPTTTPTPSPIPPTNTSPPPTVTQTASNTPPPPPTFTPSLTPSNTPIPPNTSTATATDNPTNTPITPTASLTIVSSPTPTVPTSTPVPTLTPTETPIPTWTPACPYDDPNWPCNDPTWTPTP